MLNHFLGYSKQNHIVDPVGCCLMLYTQVEAWKFREYFMFSHKCSAMNHFANSASEVELSGEAFLPFLVRHDASAVEPERRKRILKYDFSSIA